ncbi:hypothetical protein C8F04DRAFT_1040146 [Mycena alexandri]|uniref:Arrestin-like N-terminal domain-containing protein n=1 Tax=Mycena alexandri TaxID=1745969 RepID=A0AAD6STH4_9AGAR|nr:hypothetical protein C8F04DRAFT_1040146 [Mycena alexandri]
MSEALTLHFPEYVRVAGETLQGHVEINVPMALNDKVENVRIKVRGSIETRITETEHRPGGENETHYKTQTVQVLSADQQIWDHFSSPQGAQILTCPFQIQLPPNLPPSFHYSHHKGKVVISYALEVVGARHGIFHANRRIAKVFSVIPAASAWELNTHAVLLQGWNGPWKSVVNSKEMRHGILFGELSEAKIELVLPDIPSLPISTGIPFSFHVSTRTKPVHHHDLEGKHGKLFPAPPASPADIEFQLTIQGKMSAHNAHEKIEENFDVKGSLGDKAAVSAVRTIVDEPEWSGGSNTKDKGVWRRAVHFDGRFTLPYAPTFSAETAEWNYVLRLKVDFAGIGNGLELEFPIHLNSGSACPPPIGYQPNFANAYPLPAGPPPMLSLPSAYWTGDDHNYDDTQ